MYHARRDREMNKLITYIMLSVMVLSSINIKSENTPVTTGYIDTGVYFEVYEQQKSANGYSINVSNEIPITLVVSFDGVVDPPRTWTYTKDINGNLYSGTLRIHYYEVVNSKTTAEYRGTLYRQK